jgi:hypothetical protein
MLTGLLGRKPDGNELLGRPKRRCETTKYIIKAYNWIRWPGYIGLRIKKSVRRAVVNTIMNTWVP